MLHRLRLGLPVVAILFVGTAGAEVYQVDSEHSSVAFSIRHLVSRTSGNFHEFSGTINYDAGHPEKTQVEARIQAASIDTDNQRRDDHLRSGDFLEVEKYPTIGFTSTNTEVKAGVLQLTGKFTMHGVTKTITLPVKVLGIGTHPRRKVSVAGFETATVLKRSEYGVNSWTDAARVLGDEVKISIIIEALGVGE
jgi:polyisoprenoid-binding protein YceI|tara:strand:+ start:172 stop:753 length:582 start_codon:yes stop_codon:yes gene_type:complete